ncbi:hypothetical protein ACVRZR_03710 [Streptococcus entericus]|uniref:hypothetical protein n=1 Tax=Streptococcus entericus TaxID=155680 RepID=UPI000374878F|nr:hypothetical protein [Streptococcus entericus]
MMLNATIEIRDIDELARFLEEMLEKYGNKVMDQINKDSLSYFKGSFESGSQFKECCSP